MQKYTQCSHVNSFSCLLYEVSTGLKPENNHLFAEDSSHKCNKSKLAHFYSSVFKVPVRWKWRIKWLFTLSDVCVKVIKLITASLVSLWQSLLEPFSKLLSFVLQYGVFSLSYLVEICGLCYKTFSKVNKPLCQCLFQQRESGGHTSRNTIFHTLFLKNSKNNYWLFQRVTNDISFRYFHVWEKLGIKWNNYWSFHHRQCKCLLVSLNQ